MKTLILASMILFSSFANAKVYTCKLANRATPRLGITEFEIDFSEELHLSSRFILKIYETSRNSVFAETVGMSAAYAHSGNVHSGLYQDYKRFTPSMRFPPAQVFQDKLKEILLYERPDVNVAAVTLVGTKNAHYTCTRHDNR